jgi:hypothetical protein
LPNHRLQATAVTLRFTAAPEAERSAVNKKVYSSWTVESILMIHADLQGKAHVAENVLTSNCLGLLRFLPDSNLFSFLAAATDLNGETLDLSSYEKDEKK